MGITRWGPPTELITKLVTEFLIENLVETGTYKGGTAVWASQYFKKVLTIEYSKELYEKVTDEFRHISNIEFIFGDSKTELSKLLERLENPSIFWLDAHWCGGSTYGDNDECPLIEEIEILNRSKFENFIFIDDARLFTSPPTGSHKVEQWPDITAVINALQSGKTHRYVVIVEDVIIAVPIFAKATVAQYCQDVINKAWEERMRQLKNSNIRNRIISKLAPLYAVKNYLQRLNGNGLYMAEKK